jgi:multidrug efflux pump subunit AcrA (membrane-fusion protein)
MVLVAAALLVQTALLGRDLVAAQALAAQLARSAAVDGAESALLIAARVAPGADVEVREGAEPAGFVVEVRVPLRVPLSGATLTARAWAPAP